MTFIPRTHQEFWDGWQRERTRQAYANAYRERRQSFIPNLLPAQAVQLGAGEVLDILRGRLGDALDTALHPRFTDPDEQQPPALRGPVAHHPDGGWLRHTNMVGINVRTIGSFWNIVKYALTLPEMQDSIHILPIWEPGVVASLYGMSSWEINTEFFSAELAAAVPHLNTAARQLKAVVNVLHATGRAVGMDVIPHTDRFSEMALANPAHFEWLRRDDLMITDHRANLHEDVERQILAFLAAHGPAVRGAEMPAPALFFQRETAESLRIRLLFGERSDRQGRVRRRTMLIRHLYQQKYEPVPATMAPPYRGLKVDPRPEARKVDEHGMVWRDFVIAEPEPMSRVFGPLARYKLYERLDDNAAWGVDFAAPRRAVWDYVCGHYGAVQRRFGFDFMRGDMSHVQMRPGGVPEQPGEFYDILGAIKRHIARRAPHFGYFAESFLAPDGVMGYGSEVDHLEASGAEATLGDLQSARVGLAAFNANFRYYCDVARTRTVAPSFTVMTADKDDPRFDEFYTAGSAVRLFIALFLTELPSYMGLGFETRDVHHAPAPNEHYTKLFVFQEREGPKATHGPYVWGRNGALYHTLTRLRLFADEIGGTIRGRPALWLIPPHLTPETQVIAWMLPGAPGYVFLANLDTDAPAQQFTVPQPPRAGGTGALRLAFSTADRVPNADETLISNGVRFFVQALEPGEGRGYRIEE